MSTRLAIREQEFWIDGKKELLLCGEIHYFRMPPAGWEPALDRLVEAGCNAVAYYVPWFVHEYEEGKFDFTGETHPANNLAAWLELTERKGLLGFLRPGPYVYAECTNLGIPGWLLEKYPNAKVKRWHNGEYVDASAINAVGHNHPAFLAATRRWYRALAPYIRPHLAPAGNIAMVQLCNEIPCDDHNDHNPENLGTGRADGRYPTYLRGKYGTPAALNAAYGTRFAAFEEVHPRLLEEASPHLAKLERLEFYYAHYYPAYFQTLRGFLQAEGVDSLFWHNAYNPRAISLHVQNRAENPWLHVGVDSYFSLNGSLNTRDLTYFCEYGPEYCRRFLHNVPFVVEQESGYWHDYPQIHGPELYLWNLWSIVGGYRGFNMYLFAGGENRPGMGFYGTSHGWQAPVSRHGQAQESYADIRRSLRHIRRDEAALTAENAYDMALGVKRDPGLIWKEAAKSASETYFALRSEGYTPRLVDFMDPEEDLAPYPVLAVVADEEMDEACQRRLLAYMQGGGRLLLLGALPRQTMGGAPCTLLADGLGLAPGPKPDASADQQILRYGGEEFCLGQVVQPVGAPAAAVLGHSREGAPALLLAACGSGTALVAPFHINVVMQSTCRLLRLLLQRLGAQPTVTGARRLKLLPKAGGHAIVVNPCPVPVAETVVIAGRPHTLELAAYSYRIIPREGTA